MECYTLGPALSRGKERWKRRRKRVKVRKERKGKRGKRTGWLLIYD